MDDYVFPSVIKVDAETWAHLNEAILNPRPPSPALVALFKGYTQRRRVRHLKRGLRLAVEHRLP